MLIRLNFFSWEKYIYINNMNKKCNGDREIKNLFKIEIKPFGYK